LFPSVLGVDVVFGTNQEKRPLMRGTGKSAENKNLPLFNAFLPSQQRWVFDWIMTDAIPSLFEPGALKLTELILSDQDPQLCDAIDKVIVSEDKIYGAAKRRGCKWHVVRINCVMCATNIVSFAITSTVLTRILIAQFAQNISFLFDPSH
jgi:hypothetical protein